jgi:hypothetical protein
MKQLFKIDESEKRRILEMHENAVKRNYLNEQGTPTPQPTTPAQPRQKYKDANGNEYNLPAITDESKLNTFTDNSAIATTKNEKVNFILGLFVGGLLVQIGQKITDNALVCNGLKKEQITKEMRINAWSKTVNHFMYSDYELPRTVGYGDFESFLIDYAIAVEIGDQTYQDKIIQAKNSILNQVIKAAMNNIKKIPNACQS